jgi:hypothetical protein
LCKAGPYFRKATYLNDGREERCVKVLELKGKKRDHVEGLGVHGRIILRCTLKKSDGRA